MKRYNCTSSDKRGAFGLCMEEHKEGAFVPFSEVDPLNQRINKLLEERNSSGLAISNAILVGVVPDKHPLCSRLELLANHRKMLIEKSELCDDLLDLIERMVNCMGLAGEEPEKDSHNPIKAWMYDAITTMAGQRPKQSVAVTETIRTAPGRIWLQVGDQSHYHSDPFPEHHDEVSWCADSVVACEVPYVRADLAAAPLNGEKLTVTISGKGLLELVDFACPDHETDREQQETEIVLLNREAFTSTDGEKMPRGVYAYLAEYPEEGLYGPVGCQEQHGDKSLNQNPAATAGQSAPTLNKQPSITGQVLAGMEAATLLAGLDKESASDVVQLMLEAAEAKGGGSCATEPPLSSPA
ncbi:hypothetical protein GRF56_16800 [Aeromonas veronii]|uniref:hypothetical protein n=1 Tax=Aeromonas veronii TaxID=654 RepID=UPI0013194189|nr:hypothetical protein [Aeromonas veronii]QHC08937.1 hypothetical protein GRF56_16800 [Aeromonas veronii]